MLQRVRCVICEREYEDEPVETQICRRHTPEERIAWYRSRVTKEKAKADAKKPGGKKRKQPKKQTAITDAATDKAAETIKHSA